MFKNNKEGLKVLIAGTGLQFFLGILYVWSIFKAPVSVYYGWAAPDVGLTASYMLCSFVIGIIVGGKVQGRIGVKMTTLFGGLMVSAGMLATALIPAADQSEPKAPVLLLHLFYAIAGGIGVGAAYNAIITTAQKWFPNNRGFATGISVAAFGFSTVIFAPLISTFINNFGVNVTFLMLSGIFAIATLSLFSFIITPDMAADASTAKFTGKQYTMLEMLKSSRFYLITLSVMFGTSVFFIVNPDLKDLAESRGAASFAMALVMFMGVANALGRLCIPTLSDKIGGEAAGISILAATAIGAFGLCFVQGVMLIAMIIIIAFCYGGIAGLYPVLTSRNFGLKNVGSNYGAVLVGFMVSALLFPNIMKNIEGHVMKFTLLGIIASTGVVMLVVLKIKNMKRDGN